MPTWGEILNEIQQNPDPQGNPNYDGIRRKYLAQLQALTGRDVMIYSTAWFRLSGPAVSITLEDMTGMMEVCKDLPGPNLDLILHSPGGSAEATASIVRYLRRKFTHIRAFIPLAAMSAATMWALACDEIWMGKHSQLGPIDPQLVQGNTQHPARAIIQQFERARAECQKDPSLLSAWLPILQQYGPSLLEQCENAERLAKRLVTDWLARYMFSGAQDATAKATDVAAYFADYTQHQSHSLGIDRDDARSHGLNVENLESSQDLQDAVLSVHHATMHTFQGSAAKIIENHLGKAFVQHSRQLQVPFQIPVQPVPQQPPGATPQQP